MISLKKVILGALLGASLLIGSAAWAGDAPQNTVEKLLGAIVQIKDGDDVAEEQKILNRKFSEQAVAYLDMKHVGEKALGRYWKERTAEEQKTFVDLLSNLFQKIAFPNSAKFFSGLEIRYGKSTVDKDRAVAPITVLHKNEGEISIDFKLRRNTDLWRVYDVILDGVSMRNNLRSQFGRVIQKKNYEELVRKISSRLQ